MPDPVKMPALDREALLSRIAGGRRPLLNLDEVAAVLDVARKQVYVMVEQGVLPEPIRLLPRTPRWHTERLFEHLSEIQPKCATLQREDS